MANNLIPVIADCIGVRIGEEFDVNVPYMGKAKYHRYKLTEGGLLRKDGDWIPASGFLERLVCGDFEISKLPFAPKYGEEYWTYMGNNGTDDWGFYQEIWNDSVFDYIYKSAGCVFLTKEEARAALPVKYKELTGKEWEKVK